MFWFDTNNGRSFPVGTIGYELTPNNKNLSICRDEQKHLVLLNFYCACTISIFVIVESVFPNEN